MWRGGGSDDWCIEGRDRVWRGEDDPTLSHTQTHYYIHMYNKHTTLYLHSPGVVGDALLRREGHGALHHVHARDVLDGEEAAPGGGHVAVGAGFVWGGE